MAGFFAHARGAVMRLPGAHRTPTPFKIWMPGGPLSSGIITQSAVQHQGNYQFLHCVHDAIYVYVFGDRIGDLTLGGIAFGAPCRGVSGITEILQRYNNNRIAVSADPVIVALGSVAFSCFLTGFQFELPDPETLLANWTLRFNFFPSGQQPVQDHTTYAGITDIAAETAATAPVETVATPTPSYATGEIPIPS